MRVLRRFLTPGWVIGLILVVGFAYACFTLLAPWQLGKNSRLDQRNQHLTDSVSAQPAPYAELAAPEDGYSRDEWRLVTAVGSYLPDHEVLVRLQSVDGDLVYQVVSVFRTSEGREVLVNRGHIPVGENNTVPAHPAPPTGPVHIVARLRVGQTGPVEPIRLDGHIAVRSLDPAALGAITGRPVEDRGYLQLTGDQPGSLAPMPIPAVETGPYLSYGMQWIAFGILAPLGLAYFAWSELSTRRREAAERADATRTAGATTGDPGIAPAPEPPVTADERDGEGPVDDSPAPDRRPAESPETIVARARSEAVAQRYGSRHQAERRRAQRGRDRLADDRLP